MTAFTKEHVLDEVGAEVGLKRDLLRVGESYYYTSILRRADPHARPIFSVVEWESPPMRHWIVVVDHAHLEALARALTQHHVRDLARANLPQFWKLFRQNLVWQGKTRSPYFHVGAPMHPIESEERKLAKALFDNYGVEGAVGTAKIFETPSGFVYFSEKDS